MRWSNLFIPTSREVPAGADAASHKLLLRAGYIRQVTAGAYALLPLAQRVRRKIMNIIRREMEAIGGQEFFLTALQPAELWKESGRWDAIDEIMFRFKDRKGTEMALGLTHEEGFTQLARQGLNSYRQLPQIWYQMQTKFRDEARPKSGLLRVREFTMKDAYSFDIDTAGLDLSFDKHDQAYNAIFSRCGLKYCAVDASSGAMGGSKSTEFMIFTEAGEDTVVVCDVCGYSANIEKAVSQLKADADLDLDEDQGDCEALSEVATPGIKTIDELAAFPQGAAAVRQIKTLVYLCDGKPLIFLMRGDHALNEAKAQAALACKTLVAAGEYDIVKALGAHPGSLGAVGVGKEIKILADEALRGRRNMMTGANRDDVHYRGVDVARDIRIDGYFDLRTAAAGESCARCSSMDAPQTASKAGSLRFVRALEIGHIFKLGTRYSESMGAYVLNEQGERLPIVMGSYGIGVERLMAAVVEQHHDENGIIWPLVLAPYEVVITPTSNDSELTAYAASLHDELEASALEVLLDDRDERAGVKFNDAELIGVPWRVTLGKKFKEGKVELVERAGKKVREVPTAELVALLKDLKAGKSRVEQAIS
jgi:prolyl-tRNA synthetase